LKFGFTVTSQKIQFRDFVLQSLKKELTGKLGTIKDKFKFIAISIIGEAIRNSETYSSITNGILMYQLGLTYPADRIEKIIETWINNIDCRVVKRLSKTKEGLNFELELNAIQADFSDVLDLPQSRYKSFNSKGIVTEIPWLQWLLLEGDRIIVANFKVEYKTSPFSRTEEALMVKTDMQGWKVPSEYSGTISYNFVTKAVDDFKNKLQDALLLEVQKAI